MSSAKTHHRILYRTERLSVSIRRSSTPTVDATRDRPERTEEHVQTLLLRPNPCAWPDTNRPTLVEALRCSGRASMPERTRRGTDSGCQTVRVPVPPCASHSTGKPATVPRWLLPRD